jgi:extracellular factor (EF) 3-hydroxypalmitic acid methyl ester biosynthesis protein
VSEASLRPVDLPVALAGAEGRVDARVVAVSPHTLLVAFSGAAPPSGTSFDAVEVSGVSLGRCSFQPHPDHPLRRQDDPPAAPGDGRLMFETVYDFSGLVRDGSVGDVKQKLAQLPLVWQRKEGIRPAFREYVADLVYDIQAYRLLLDDIDRNLSHEPIGVRARIRYHAIGVVYPDFAAFFDAGLERLAEVTRGYTRQEHERHGFYFRRQVWDLILASPFLSRTNLKPRGYAGDSQMMQMIYDDAHRGATLFAMCMHRHPIRTAAAQAVRNRRRLIAQAVHARLDAGRPVRLLSVACGPATELGDLVRGPEDAARLELVLLDQDGEALAEAKAGAAAVSQRVGRPLAAEVVQQSVRTMLRPAAARALGDFDLVYTMGLFDYLQAPVARVVLANLYALLRPGGEIIVGNFHVKNPTRLYMDYWMDWTLVYRTEEDMLALAAPLEPAACDLGFEETGSQMFLRVRKAA